MRTGPSTSPACWNGIADVGIHAGGGGRNRIGNQTTFYEMDARDLDHFLLIASGGSTATVFATVVAAVPEPAARRGDPLRLIRSRPQEERHGNEGLPDAAWRPFRIGPAGSDAMPGGRLIVQCSMRPI